MSNTQVDEELRQKIIERLHEGWPPEAMADRLMSAIRIDRSHAIREKIQSLLAWQFINEADLFKFIEHMTQQLPTRESHKGTEDTTLRKHFEANMLDGESVDDCGGAMISAKSVLEYMQEYLGTSLKNESTEVHTYQRFGDEGVTVAPAGASILNNIPPTSGSKGTGEGETLAQIRKCFTDTQMEEDEELTLFDTDQTIENIAQWHLQDREQYTSKVIREVYEGIKTNYPHVSNKYTLNEFLDALISTLDDANKDSPHE